MLFRRLRMGLLALLLFSGAAHALDVPLISASPEMFRAHREKFMARMAPNSIAVLRSAPRRTMSNDTEYLYRQDSNFYYLTGFEDPEAVAVLRPNATDGKRFLLFVRARNPRRETYDGKRPSPEEAAAARGADAAFTTDDFFGRLVRYDATTRTFSGYLADIEKIYLSDAGDTAWAEKFREAVESMRARDTGPATVEDARHLAHELRVVKDPEEIKLIRRATEISARGHERAMKAAAPGKYEFEVQHALDGYCYANGARRMAYPSIVGSGPNSIYLHWDRNDRQMKDGDVILNDSGAEYGYYATDITRTYPVSGKFSPEQKAIYEVVLAAQKEAMAAVKPGRPHDEVGKASFRAQTAGLVKLGLLSGDVDKLVREGAHRQFTVHGVSHGVGLDVHDAGRYGNRLMEPGMTFTIEPGIYIPEGMDGVDRKWWNIGVRIEDVVLVTPDGYECLSCSAPRELADVERTVRGR